MSEFPGALADEFIHIPGPNPILRPGPPGAWDDKYLEACDILKDADTYYFYYHATSEHSGYQIGVVTADHPLGPFQRVSADPLLAVGPAGSWDEDSVACAFILKEHADKYYLFYSGISKSHDGGWGIGLATATSPLGPWVKHPANPILPGFGYVGGVVRTPDGYSLYTEHPIGSRGPDYGPISRATAKVPEGPWTPSTVGLILGPGEWGEWDDGGFSEAKVVCRDGHYHMFYGGARLHPERLLSQESIGYAFSPNGWAFQKHPRNPVAPRENNPDAAAFAEVHCHIEPPFVYLYHTHRYNSRPNVEHLGVQVLALQRPFSLAMPLLQVASLGPDQQTTLDDCPPLCLAQVSNATLTVEGHYPDTGSGELVVTLFSSADGLTYDTEAICLQHVSCGHGRVTRRTFAIPADVMFLKCLLHNSSVVTASDLKLTATLSA
jgi:hypothetical protein